MSDMPSTTWQRDDGVLPKRNVLAALMRGVVHRCPACGHGRLFRSFLKVSDTCPDCGEALHHHRADDAPPYFTIVIVGHIIVPLVLFVETTYAPSVWIQNFVWLPLTLVLALLTLPAVKGALVAYQWALYMHGFDPRAGGDEAWDGVGFNSGRVD